MQKNIWSLSTVDIREFGIGVHRAVDDIPYGGGCGMVMRPDVVHKALIEASRSHPSPHPSIIFVTPRGCPLKQPTLFNLASNTDGCIILCGRYEGIDERVIQFWKTHHNLMEISMGDYVLSGGEMAALTILDGCIRLLPQVMSKESSFQEESFQVDLLEFSQYTRPRVWSDFDILDCKMGVEIQGLEVPNVLLSGHHENIRKWRLSQSEKLTQQRRLDLYEMYLKNQLVTK